jgi:uncharacterized protein YecE (DUF72 family)
VAETPDTFRFCPKLPRTISHAGNLVDHLEEALQFLETMSQLGPRLGPLFLQLPPRYPPGQLPDLQAFLENWSGQARSRYHPNIPEISRPQLAVEVRHTGWFESPHHETLNALLSEHGAARVTIDTRPIRDLREDPILQGSVYKRLLEARLRKPDLPIISQRTAEFVFIRYIGHPKMEYNEPLLDEWANRIAGWLQEGSEAFIFCHCPDERLDPWLCRAFHERVGAIVPLSPLPWDEAEPPKPYQPRLI